MNLALLKVALFLVVSTTQTQFSSGNNGGGAISDDGDVGFDDGGSDSDGDAGDGGDGGGN